MVLKGNFVIPDAKTLILSVQHDGNSRRSPRNYYFSHLLCEVGLAKLLLDLVTVNEENVNAQMG